MQYQYNDKIPGLKDKGQQVGVIAQDLQKIAPDMVVEDKAIIDGEETEILKVNYSKFIWIVINAVKELHTMVLDLFDFQAEAKREIASLKEENKVMKEYLCQKDPEAPFCQNKEGHE